MNPRATCRTGLIGPTGPLRPAAFTLFALLLGGTLLVTAPAFALSLDDIVEMARADASDSVILSQIEVDGTIFHLTVNDILRLKEAGVSDTVITYMINTGKSGEAPAEETVTQPEPEPEPQQDGEYYATDLDNRYRSSVSVSVGFGYYYPHWPGYQWSYYYDPFWWPSMAFYFAYWQPYPYYYWYYSPWYYANRYIWGYFHPHYYGHYNRYHHGHGGYYGGGYGGGHSTPGRNVGNRGDVTERDRRVKNPGGGDVARADVARTYRTPDPGTTTRSDVARATPDRRLRSGNPTAEVYRNRAGRQVGSGPAPADLTQSLRAPRSRTVRPTPVTSRTVSRPPSSVSRSYRGRPARSGTTGSVARAPRGSSRGSRPAPAKVGSSPSRGKSVTKAPRGKRTTARPAPSSTRSSGKAVRATPSRSHRSSPGRASTSRSSSGSRSSGGSRGGGRTSKH